MVRSKTQTTLQSTTQAKPMASISPSAPIVLDSGDGEDVKAPQDVPASTKTHKDEVVHTKAPASPPRKSPSAKKVASPPRKSPSPKKATTPSPKKAKKAAVVIDDDVDDDEDAPFVVEKEEAHEAKSMGTPSAKKFKYRHLIHLPL
jgi:hypothetical protein